MIADIKDNNVADAIYQIKNAFDQFESQSTVLASSYQVLKKDLAQSNKQLNIKNKALSRKVIELNDMSNRLHCILNSLADSVLVINSELVIERCNSAATLLFDLKTDQIEGSTYRDVAIDIGDLEMLTTVIKTGKSFINKERVHSSDKGNEIVVMASVAPIHAQDGSVIGAVEVLRSVTELRYLQEKINCQKRMVALGEMAASVAHEIRNPLGTIEGFARLLKRDLMDQPEHLRLASKIVEGVQNLNYVITNLLTYARPMSIQTQEFETTRLMNEIVELLSDKARREGVTISIINNDPFESTGDIRQLRQVLLNLGLNAIEACLPGGHVFISAQNYEHCTCFVISDDGCGIQADDQQKIFDPFFTNKHGGTGLGLSLCHKIISAHAGEIEVVSEPGKGSTFEVTLPWIGEAA